MQGKLGEADPGLAADEGPRLALHAHRGGQRGRLPRAAEDQHNEDGQPGQQPVAVAGGRRPGAAHPDRAAVLQPDADSPPPRHYLGLERAEQHLEEQLHLRMIPNITYPLQQHPNTASNPQIAAPTPTRIKPASAAASPRPVRGSRSGCGRGGAAGGCTLN